MNDDLLKKEATTDSRSETFSSIMKVREKRERDKEETEEGGVGRGREERETEEREGERRGEEVEKRVHCFSFFSSHCVTYAQSFLVVMTLRHFVSK